MSSADPLVRGARGGIPFFATEVPGPFWAGLVFRVGHSDETAPTTGVSHLVEHLLMPDSVYPAVDCNGTVDGLLSSIWAHGEQDDVRRFLEEVAGRIAELPVERLELERRILATEEGTVGWSSVRQALALRFGPVGAGLTGYGDLGLERLTEDDARTWTAERFTAGNAALAATDPAFEIDLALPPGPARPVPALRPIEYVEYPCLYPNGAPGAMLLSVLAERTTAFTMGLRILERRLRNRLRFELGIAYEVEVDYYPVSESVAHAWIGADNGLSQPQQWFTETLALLDAMAADGPSQEELDVERAVRERAESDPGSWIPYLGWVAGEHLVGNPYLSRADAVREAREVTPEDVASAFGRARQTLLVVTTDEVTEPSGFSQYPMFSTHWLEGRRHRPSGLRARLGRGERRELISSPDGISVVYPEYGAVTARYDATVLCIREGGVRTLLSDDGFFVPVDPEAWHGGAQVVAEIDAAVPSSLVKSVDAAQDGRADAVGALAESTFKRTWLVSEELALLPSLLDDGESPVALATASKGWKLGLLAVTDRHVRFLYGDGTSHSFTVDRDAVSARRNGKSKLELLVDGEWVKLTDVGPKGQAEEVERLLAAPVV